MDVTQMMAEDAATKAVKLPSNEELDTVGRLANEQLRLEKLVNDTEALLKLHKETLAKVQEVDLPKALEAFGLMSVTLLDKSVVTIKEEVYAGITAENREAAFGWLEATDNDGIIKNEVKCQFGKGQDEEAKKLMELLEGQGYSFTGVRNVHPQTLKAFVRKQLEDGLPIPTDVFSIHVKKVSSIKLPK